MSRENKPNKFRVILSPMHGQQGTVIVYVGLLIAVLIGFTYFSVDFTHLIVGRNELQDAADAGALAGAGRLYNQDGTAVNLNANQFAYDAAVANISEKLAVEVNWTPGTNTGDVERGHWSFATRCFTPSDRTEPPQLWDYTTQELDDCRTFDPNCEPCNPSYRSSTALVNAVRVRTNRISTPLGLTNFARFWGIPTYPMYAKAVAYLGFAGSLSPGEVDQPIAICKQAILNFDDPDNPEFTCGVGRMINSGSNVGHETGGWTNFSQSPCIQASTPTVRPLICLESGNPNPLSLGDGIGATGGEIQAAYDDLIRCWQTQAGLPPNPNSNNPADFPTSPWRMKLPVINCTGNNVSNCSELEGAVEVNVLWITRTGFKNSLTPLPNSMTGIANVVEDWTSPGGTPQANWDSFVAHFRLWDVLNETPATPEDKTIYFLPDCSPHELSGRTGGPNFGILAKIPVLVAPWPKNP